MSLRPDPKKMESELSAMEGRMEKARRLLSFLRGDGQDQWASWLAEEIALKMEGLCNPDLPEKETAAMRAEIWTLRRVSRLAKDKEAEMVQIAEQAKHLRDRLTALHNRGRDVEQALDTADRIARGKP